MYTELFGWIQRHERHLSAAAMVVGFVVDNIFFDRIDLGQTQLVFVAYTLVCFISIPLLHWLESHDKRPRWRFILPLATQFALGGFWSGFVVFYGRSADLGASWPFLLFLVLILLASEYFHRSHERLVFTSILFFFALYSTAIFLVPIYTHTIDTLTFFESGALAIGLFGLFTMFLRRLGRTRFLEDVWRIRAGALLVLVVINLAYLTDVLPPLPLSLSAAGIYHQVWRVPGAYMATNETGQSWLVRHFDFAPTLHVRTGKPVFAYAEVFAPTALSTTLVHEWQWYDPSMKKWVTRARIRYPILGGREQGYRGYTFMPTDQAGKWRVNVETVDGRIIARLPFTVEYVADAPTTETITL